MVEDCVACAVRGGEAKGGFGGGLVAEEVADVVEVVGVDGREEADGFFRGF